MNSKNKTSRVRYCSVENCENNSENEKGTLHKLPTDCMLRSRWVNMCNLKNLSSKTFVCNAHFKEQDYTWKKGEYCGVF